MTSPPEIRRRISEAQARGAAAERYCREIMREVATEVSALRACCKHENLKPDAWVYGVSVTCLDCGAEVE